MLNCMYTNLPKKGKFIALFADGSGANLFTVLKTDEIINAEGIITYANTKDMSDVYSKWINITNEKYKYWYEQNKMCALNN